MQISYKTILALANEDTFNDVLDVLQKLHNTDNDITIDITYSDMEGSGWSTPTMWVDHDWPKDYLNYINKIIYNYRNGQAVVIYDGVDIYLGRYDSFRDEADTDLAKRYLRTIVSDTSVTVSLNSHHDIAGYIELQRKQSWHGNRSRVIRDIIRRDMNNTGNKKITNSDEFKKYKQKLFNN